MAAPDTSISPAENRLVIRATAVVVVITAAGALLGLVRDLMLAGFFGATARTDAFLVAWTIPETASPLLIEGAMTLLMVPVFVRASTRGIAPRDVVGATLPKLAMLLAAVTLAVVLAAPVLVRLLAPGLAEPGLAVLSMRVAALTVLMFGLAGYLGAALRAQHIFGVPAAIYAAYNIGIIGAILLLGGHLGVLAAAIGLSAGAVLMVVVQLPTFLRRVGLPRFRSTRRAAELALGAFVPVVVFTVVRQAQVFVERFFGSSLEPGTISHLNYAQKVAQLPMALAVMLATVSFPLLARSFATGDDARSRERTEWDLRVVCGLVLAACAYLVAFAPQIVTILFGRGAFTAGDVTTTAAIMRVYALGLVGQAAVVVLSRCYFSGNRPAWVPAVAMAVGLTVTVLISAAFVARHGSTAIAAANAVGISTTAVLMLIPLRDGPGGVSLRRVGTAAAGLWAAGIAAGVAGWLLSRPLASGSVLVVAAAGIPVVLGTFALVAVLTKSLVMPWPARLRREGRR